MTFRSAGSKRGKPEIGKRPFEAMRPKPLDPTLPLETHGRRPHLPNGAATYRVRWQRIH